MGAIAQGVRRHALRRHRRGQPVRRRPDLHRRRHVQVDRRRRRPGRTSASTTARAIGRVAVDPTNPNVVYAAASGVDLAHGQPARPLQDDRRRRRRGPRSSRRRTTRPARSTWPSTRRTRSASTPRCGTTSATTARASTAASAPACSAPMTAARRGRGCRTSPTPLPDYDRPPTAAAAPRHLTTGSTAITGVTTTSGAFQVGHQHHRHRHPGEHDDHRGRHHRRHADAVATRPRPGPRRTPR